jgi:MFS transporter, DHA3 family, tetracycline resistance protein
MRLRPRQLRPYPLYLILQSGTAFLTGVSYATVTVYWVTVGRLNPLQLLLLGTALELSYFVFQLPTGLLADLASRRLCVLTGLFIVGVSQVLASLSPSYPNLITAWVVLGIGAALNNGAEEAWIADELSAELGDHTMTGVYLRATQLGLAATVAGSLLSGVIALGGLELPLRVGGALTCLLATAAAVVMPERHFHRPAAAAGVRQVARQSARLWRDQTRSAHRAVVAVPASCCCSS